MEVISRIARECRFSRATNDEQQTARAILTGVAAQVLTVGGSLVVVGNVATDFNQVEARPWPARDLGPSQGVSLFARLGLDCVHVEGFGGTAPQALGDLAAQGPQPRLAQLFAFFQQSQAVSHSLAEA